MRILHSLTAVALVAAAAPAVAADYQATITSTNPLANFRLTAPGEPSTVNGYSTTWTPTTGTGPGAPIASDPANTAATFTGDNSNPSVVRTGLFGGIPGRGTVNVWANFGALVTGGVFTLTSEAQGGNDFDFQVEGGNVLRFYTGGGENTAYQLDPTTLVGQWHMFTASYDGTLGANGFRNLYMDGVQVASFTGFVNGATKTSQFTIGYNDLFTGRDFNGSLDEVTVWDYGLDAGQVAAIYRASFDPGATPAGVPEPASWAMLIMGFGLTGAAMRTHRRGVAFAA